MTRILEAELAVTAQCELAEGPVWDAGRGLLWWVDILVGHVHTVDPVSGARTRFDAGDPVGAVGLTRGGGLVLALVDGFALADHDGQRLTAPCTSPPPARATPTPTAASSPTPATSSPVPRA